MVRIADAHILARIFVGTAISSVLYAPDGGSIAVGCDDGWLQLIDVATGTTPWDARLRCEDAKHLAYSTDGGRVAVAGGDGRLLQVEAATAAILSSWNLHGGSVYSVLYYSIQDVVLAGCGDGRLRALDRLSGERKWVVDLQCGFVDNIALSQDGSTVAAGGQDKIRLLKFGADSCRVSAGLDTSVHLVSNCIAFTGRESVFAADCYSNRICRLDLAARAEHDIAAGPRDRRSVCAVWEQA